jgi:hypothetical protein
LSRVMIGKANLAPTLLMLHTRPTNGCVNCDTFWYLTNS